MNKQGSARNFPAVIAPLLLVGVMLCVGRPAFSAPQESSSPKAPLAERTSDDIQKEAVDLMKHGRRFDIAIAELTYIIRRDRHTDRVARNYLGCALAAQAYAYATYLDDKAKFAKYDPNRPPDRMTVLWQQAQERGSGLLYGVRLPAPPLPPKMMDGSKCNLSDEELPKVMADTTRHAESLLGFVLPKALKSATPKPASMSPTPAAGSGLTAEQLDDRAWAELLLRVGPLSHMDARYESWAIAEAMEDNLRAALTKDDSLERQKCLGDALVLSCNYPRLLGRSVDLDYDPEMLKRGLETLTKIADKVHGHAAAWFFIGTNQYDTTPSDALASWKKAASYNHDNAIYPYACAQLLVKIAENVKDSENWYKDVPTDEVSDYLSAGNACAYLAPADYKVESPVIARWAFHDLRLLNWLQITAVRYYICLECDKKRKAKDFQGACADARQIAIMGNLFLNAAKDQNLPEGQVNECFFIGKFSLRDVGREVAEIKIASPDSSLTADLDYCLDFLSDSQRSYYEKKLQ